MYKWVLKWRLTFVKGQKMEVKDKNVVFFWITFVFGCSEHEKYEYWPCMLLRN